MAGSHSHRVSGWKQHLAQLRTSSAARPSFCFYGLGSLVSGYAASPIEREGLIIVASLNLSGSLVRLEARPVLLDAAGLAAIPSTSESDAIFDRFIALSEELADGSFARHFYQDASRGLIPFYLRDARTAFRQSGFGGLARKAGRFRMRHLRRLVHVVID